MNNFNHVIDYNDKSHKTINSDYGSGYQGAGDMGGGMWLPLLPNWRGQL